MKHLQGRQQHFRLTLALCAGACAALVAVVVAVATQSPDDHYAPYGISPEDATALTGESRALWEADLALHQTAIAGTPGPRGTPFDPPFQTPIPDPTGFVGPNPTTNMGFGNAWYGEIQGQRVALFAGFSRADESKGMLLVTDGGPAWGPSLYAQTFDGSGPLRVVDVADGVAYLDATLSGVTYSFDVATLQVSSPTPSTVPASPVPVTTPIP